MKCCGSQTTSIVPKATAVVANASQSSRAREAAAAFSALLLGEALKPLAAAMGFYGDTVARLAAQSMARGERGGLTDRLERAIEAASRPDPSRGAGA